ncbi:hypothetical protein BDV12DRAFT_84264 [Aspergillus spectabilis]
MTHVITLSSAAMRRPPATSSAISSRILYSILRYQNSSSQIRGLWGCSHQRYNHDRHRSHVRFILSMHHRVRRPHHPTREQTIYPNHDYQSWWSPDWGWSSSKARFPKFQPRRKDRDEDKKRPKNEYWESPKDRAQQRMEWVKKEIEADPYTALFGRRLEPFSFGSGFKLENTFTELWRSLLGIDKGSSRTVDMVVRAKADNADSSSAQHGKAQEPIKQEVRSQSTPDLKTEFQFDPISGRMVPKKSEALRVTEEGYKWHSAADDTITEHKIGAEELGIPSRIENVETKSSDSLVVDSLTPNSAVSENSRELEAASATTTTSHSQMSASSPIQNAPDCRSKWLEGSPEAIRAKSAQSDDRFKPLSPADHDECDVMSRDHTTRPDQNPNLENLAVPEERVTGLEESKEVFNSLGRVGFLSRRDIEPPTPVTPGITQEKTVTDSRDENLDQLRASNIRAAYDSRRLSIASEIEAEKLTDPGPFSASYAPSATDMHSHDESLECRIEIPSTAPEEVPISRASSYLEDQLQHEEPATVSESLTYVPPTPEVYRIFAYDPSTLQVTEAEVLSSLQESREHLHPAEVLTRLAHPAKFLPCLNQMHAKGFEIVSGGEDILVFRKASHAESLTTSHLHEKNVASSSSIDEGYSEEGSTSSQQPPSGFYTGNVPDHPSSTDQSHSKTLPKSKVRKVLRRMFISGAATAGTCYALSVVGEYFRTGGEDGRGFDGFTTFESDRRHRE